MLRLKLVKTPEAEDAAEQYDGQDLNHGCKVLKQLIHPWIRTNRVVCADSYFASVSTAMEMKRLGMRFIGIVKQATKMFPQAYLQQLEFGGRGEWKGVATKDEQGEEKMYAFVWVDRERRYFITNTSSLATGTPCIRERLRQIQPVESNLPPEQIEITINQPMAVELYYGVCSKIDHHNRRRHDGLRLESKLETNDWSKRVNMSIFGMIVVDCFLVYSQLVQQEAENDFYVRLAEELIDNEYDSVARRRSTNAAVSPEAMGRDGRPRAGTSAAHLTPTKKRKRDKPNQSQQSKCVICKKKTCDICSACFDADPTKEVAVCHSKTGRPCFAQHLAKSHST